jgi:DNA-binding CsgD family transcriptional regulator
MTELPFAQHRRVEEWILAGRSDEEIAMAMLISVKQVRVIRRALEERVRPR